MVGEILSIPDSSNIFRALSIFLIAPLLPFLSNSSFRMRIFSNACTPSVRRSNRIDERAQCNNAPGFTTTEARNSLLPKIDSIQLPPGYHSEWQGEYLASTQSKQYLFKNVPIAIVLVLVILIALFGDFRKPLMILLCLPLAIIGIVAGMLLAGKEFGFVAIVGALGLVGMMIKNGVVLVDEVNIQIQQTPD